MLNAQFFSAECTIFLLVLNAQFLSAECSFLVLNAVFLVLSAQFLSAECSFLVLNAVFLVLSAQFLSAECSCFSAQCTVFSADCCFVVLKARQHVVLRTQIGGAKSHLEGEKSLKFMNIWCYMNK